MLKDKASSAIVAVSDLAVARRFYGGVLGLSEQEASDHLVQYRTGDTTLTVYISEYAGTNRANAVVWGVGDEIEAIAADLAGNGVVFEQYDLDGASYRDGIYRIGDFRMLWFKDPDGNILHINSA